MANPLHPVMLICALRKEQEARTTFCHAHLATTAFEKRFLRRGMRWGWMYWLARRGTHLICGDEMWRETVSYHLPLCSWNTEPVNELKY